MKKVLTFGEVMLRLSPPRSMRLQQATSFDLKVGGAEFNVAAALTGLGVHSAFLTALPDNPLGDLAAAEIRRTGVDDSLLIRPDRGRMGLYFVEFGASPRPSRVIYDRADSAASTLGPGDVDWKNALGEYDHFHTTGVTAALSRGCLELAASGLETAKESGLSTSFDLNYRARLWSEEEAGKALTPLMEHVDHLITTEEDTGRVFGIKGGEYDGVAKKLVGEFGFKSVAITLREDISVLRNRWTAIAWDGRTLHGDKAYDVEIIDRIGAGDAFAAGYIFGVLAGDLALGVRVGNAASAIKHTIPGDVIHCTLDEVLGLAESETRSLRIQR